MENFEQSSCPDLEDLLQFTFGELDPNRKVLIGLHVIDCHLCAQEIEVLQLNIATTSPIAETEPSKKMFGQLKELARRTREELIRRRVNYTPEQLRTGQIWSTKTEVIIPGYSEPIDLAQQSRLVLICCDDRDAYDPNFPEIRVAPISGEVENATDFDLIIDQEQCPLGYELMLECWNSQPMLSANLDKFLGEVTFSVMEDVWLLLRAQVGDPINLSQLQSQRGRPLLSLFDRRKDFLLQEVIATEYLRTPVNALHEYWQTSRSL